MTDGSSAVAERRRGRPINGWLVIDKPAGITSAAVVNRVRRATGAAKAGHGGTLDPLATGVLPIALGEATKTVSYVMDGRKVYRFTVRWGEQRNTDDAEASVTAISDVRARRRGDPGGSRAASRARSSRCRRPSRRSRSPASGPTRWPAPTFRSSWRHAG